MIKLFQILCTIAALALMCNIASCGTGTGSTTLDTTEAAPPYSISQDTIQTGGYEADNDYAIMYIVVVDTGAQYASLQSAMYTLSQKTGMIVDTMNRYYNKQKDKIVLSENEEDDMYRGEYVPRRFPSTTLSLEYYSIYNDSSTDKNIALVAGLFENAREADSLLRILKPSAPHSFAAMAKVFVGCIH